MQKRHYITFTVRLCIYKETKMNRVMEHERMSEMLRAGVHICICIYVVRVYFCCT